MRPLTSLLVIPPLLLGAAMAGYVASRHNNDPTLDACAREHNVYACEYVAQPVRTNLLPPPEGEDK